MTLYILDTEALLGLEVSATASGMHVATLQARLTQLLEDGALATPLHCIEEARRLDGSLPVVVWARAARGDLGRRETGYGKCDEVLAACPRLLDEFAVEVSTPVLVASLALDRSADGPIVVTGELGVPVGRESLAAACAACGIAVLTLAEFVATIL